MAPSVPVVVPVASAAPPAGREWELVEREDGEVIAETVLLLGDAMRLRLPAVGVSFPGIGRL